MSGSSICRRFRPNWSGPDLPKLTLVEHVRQKCRIPWQVHSFGVPQSRRPGHPMNSHSISWFRVGGVPHGHVQFGIPLSGSSWEDVKLIRGTTCVLAGRLPPGSGHRLSGHRPVGIRQGGCLLHERAFSLGLYPPLGPYPPRVFAKISRSLARALIRCASVSTPSPSHELTLHLLI